MLVVKKSQRFEILLTISKCFHKGQNTKKVYGELACGSRKFLQNRTGYNIEPIKAALSSMDNMHKWTNENIGDRFDNTEMRRLLVEATFVQAKEDGVALLEIGEDVWGACRVFFQ